MSQRWQTRYLPAAICAFLGLLLIKSPQLAARGFTSGLYLCTNTVLPALFPFFVLCDLLLSCPMEEKFLRPFTTCFGLQSSRGALTVLLSWFGGYAVCAQLVGTLRRGNQLDARDSALVLMLGCCSGPGFVIGCVGGLLLGNPQLGILLYGLQLAANLMSTALCIPFLPKADRSAQKSGQGIESGAGLSRAIGKAVNSSMNVCGCVLFFRIITTLLTPFLPPIPFAPPALSAVLEISSGCADFAALGGSIALYGCCACLSLLGLSVWAQMAMLLQGAVSLRLLLCNRLLHLIFFCGIVHLLARTLPGTMAVYRTLSQRVITMQRLPLDAALIVFLFLCAALYKVRQNFYNK